jgi:hypothetical protein
MALPVGSALLVIGCGLLVADLDLVARERRATPNLQPATCNIMF